LYALGCTQTPPPSRELAKRDGRFPSSYLSARTARGRIIRAENNGAATVRVKEIVKTVATATIDINH